MLNEAARYRVQEFHSSSLENNPLGSPVDRLISVYLPPGYFENTQRKYPVIYYLHGYDGNHSKLTILPTNDDLKKLAGFLTPELAAQIKLDRVACYSMLDDMISRCELKPFVLVQPDGSLLMPKINNAKDIMTGLPATKGSFYVNTAATGKYEDYIIKDVIRFVESNYRVIPDVSRRAVAGTSMGGYGALSIYFRHPDMFAAVAVASPANFTVDSLTTKYVQPMMIRLLGRETAEQMGSAGMNDILDTLDLVYSKERPLLPTVKRDEQGGITCYDSRAAANWARYDLNKVIDEAAAKLHNANIMFDCDKDDEFALAQPCVTLHKTLIRHGIKHIFELYSDADAALSPHTLGTGYHIITHLKYCSEVINK